MRRREGGVFELSTPVASAANGSDHRKPRHGNRGERGQRSTGDDSVLAVP
jgi:hypothetical protein